jgi:predicted transcriptional regulator
MKAHNGMRPQDIVILMKILILKDSKWQMRTLAESLNLSISEISESLHRSHIAGLVDVNKKNVFRMSFMEFIEFGFKYVFPQIPGSLVTGIATAHSHEFFKEKIISEINFVWPDNDGDVRGLAILPLYKSITKVVLKDKVLYNLLACLDILRVGKVREKKMALKILKEFIL